MPLGAGSLYGKICARSAAAVLGRLRPLAVLTEANEKPLGRSSTVQGQVATGPRYIMHSLVREIAAGMLASHSQLQQSRVRMLFTSYMLSKGDELLSMEVSPSTLAPAQQLLSNELANFGGLVCVLEQLDREHCYLDPARIGRCDQLACALVKRGHLQPAVGLLRVLLRACESRLGRDDVLTLVVTARLADTLRRCQQLDEARQLGRRVLWACEALLGPKHPDTITARAILALILLQRGQVGEALEMQRTVLISSEQVLGYFHVNTVFLRFKRATALLADGQLQEAERMLERVLEAQEASLGPKHLHTMKTCATLADVMEVSGRPEEAILLRCRVLWTRLEVLGLEHMDTNEMQRELVDLFVSFFKDDAARLCSGLSLLMKALEPTTLAALDTYSNFAVLDTVLDARWLAFDTLHRRVGAHGPDSTTTAVALATLAAVILTVSPSHADNVPGYMRQQFEHINEALGPRHMRAVGVSRSLGGILSACRQRWGLAGSHGAPGFGWESYTV